MPCSTLTEIMRFLNSLQKHLNMKFINYFILLFSCLLPVMLNAQSSEEVKRNEIGTDITSLLERILNFNQSEFFSPYSATYQITYKRHFNKVSLRTGIGGNTSSEDVDNNFSEEVIKRTSQRINYRIGIEKAIELDGRWGFYYGIDFRHSISNSRNDFWFSNGGWRHGYDRKGSVIGFSPLFGLEFKISDRIALQTEANFIAYFSRIESQPIITQIAENPSFEMPSSDLEIDKSRGTAFNVPNFLVLTIRL